MRLFLAALAVCVAGTANALTVTFDIDLANDQSVGSNINQGTSQGYAFNYATVYNFGNFINLHDDNGVLSTTITPVDGKRFAAHTVDLVGWSLAYTTGSGPAPTFGTSAYYQWLTGGPAAFPTLTFSGLRNGAVVASQTFAPMALSTVGLNGAFSAIDALQITFNSPAPIWGIYPTTPNTAWCSQWCGEFHVDNLVVAPVPLPASGLLLIGAVLGLFGYRRLKTT
ncbi:VPLPA-CTERM sorting domain-containing protein [uncultured Ruegeria sp.]|uniref:VPLPA-CTERM sorting domain-containing protein n=1 Tax=uncultured Ruegeria sp. TaxID=259304 RepID=UPI002601F3AF|nr:VPLPA-CTERM sorting domain-containing protein [uncultured Ruegeria sp.]